MTSSEDRSVRVLLVDEHEIVRAGLRTLLGSAGIEIAGEAPTVAEAISAAKRLKPDMVLMDVRLPDGSGVEACREIRATHPGIKILFLTAFEDDDAMLATVFANADGYLLKEIGGENLIRAIKTAAQGLSVLDRVSRQHILERLRKQIATVPDGGENGLSAQERRVLALVAESKTNKEIAAAMGLSPKTVKNYLSHIFQKLQITRRSEAAIRFARATPHP